ncbi:MAG: sigma 54-interacting transcriptional regulator, partial [Nitrospiria bacterium]
MTQGDRLTMEDDSKDEMAERALWVKEEHFHKIFDHSNDAIFVIDIEQDKILDVNPKASVMLGYSRDELLSLPMRAIHPHEMPKLTAFSHSVLQQGYGWTDELTCLTKSGVNLPSEISASLIDMSGRACLIAIVRDITERKHAEEALRESKERFSRILESAMDAIVTLDREGRIMLFNTAAEKAFRCSAAKVIGQPFAPFLSERFRHFLMDYIRALDQKSVPHPYTWVPEGFTAIRATGEEFPIEASLSHVEVKGQKLYTIILRDIDDRRRAEEELRKMQLANLYLQEEIKIEYNLEEIVGKSRALKKVLKNVEMVAGIDSLVLITGDTGTGKELIARAVHNLSRRKVRALIKVNCGALPAGLIESELFGHEKGAFTGAISRKIGRFEMADGGTLFLDEIGALPQDLQPKLLRVLQEGEFERVGGTHTFKVDVRVIAATNRDLKKAVKGGSFRADLYYRLNVFPVHLPPLKERKEDIPLLTQYFLNKYAKRTGRRIEKIGQETIERLIAYPWPGNVRELENVIERAVILSKRPILEIEDELLPSSSLSDKKENFPKSLEEIEREYIVKTLDATR